MTVKRTHAAMSPVLASYLAAAALALAPLASVAHEGDEHPLSVVRRTPLEMAIRAGSQPWWNYDMRMSSK